MKTDSGLQIPVWVVKTITGLIVFPVAAVIGLYQWGMLLAGPVTTPPPGQITKRAVLHGWMSVGGVGAIGIEQKDPFTGLADLATASFAGEAKALAPSDRALSRSVRRLLRERSGTLTAGELKLASWSMTIWLSRNWSTEQILVFVSGLDPYERQGFEQAIPYQGT